MKHINCMLVYVPYLVVVDENEKKLNYFSTNNQKNNRRCIGSYNFIHSRHLSHTVNFPDNCLTTFVNCCLTESLLGVFIYSMNFATINAIHLFIFSILSLSHLELFETAIIFTMIYGLSISC